MSYWRQVRVRVRVRVRLGLRLKVRVRVRVEKVMLLAAGGAHSLAVTKEGVVFSWGEGSQGQLGLGACQASARPQGIASLLEQSPVVGPP